MKNIAGDIPRYDDFFQEITLLIKFIDVWIMVAISFYQRPGVWVKPLL